MQGETVLAQQRFARHQENFNNLFSAAAQQVANLRQQRIDEDMQAKVRAHNQQVEQAQATLVHRGAVLEAEAEGAITDQSGLDHEFGRVGGVADAVEQGLQDYDIRLTRYDADFRAHEARVVEWRRNVDERDVRQRSNSQDEQRHLANLHTWGLEKIAHDRQLEAHGDRRRTAKEKALREFGERGTRIQTLMENLETHRGLENIDALFNDLSSLDDRLRGFHAEITRIFEAGNLPKDLEVQFSSIDEILAGIVPSVDEFFRMVEQQGRQHAASQQERADVDLRNLAIIGDIESRLVVCDNEVRRAVIDGNPISKLNQEYSLSRQLYYQEILAAYQNYFWQMELEDPDLDTLRSSLEESVRQANLGYEDRNREIKLECEDAFQGLDRDNEWAHRRQFDDAQREISDAVNTYNQEINAEKERLRGQGVVYLDEGETVVSNLDDAEEKLEEARVELRRNDGKLREFLQLKIDYETESRGREDQRVGFEAENRDYRSRMSRREQELVALEERGHQAQEILNEIPETDSNLHNVDDQREGLRSIVQDFNEKLIRIVSDIREKAASNEYPSSLEDLFARVDQITEHINIYLREIRDQIEACEGVTEENERGAAQVEGENREFLRLNQEEKREWEAAFLLHEEEEASRKAAHQGGQVRQMASDDHDKMLQRRPRPRN